MESTRHKGEAGITNAKGTEIGIATINVGEVESLPSDDVESVAVNVTETKDNVYMEAGKGTDITYTCKVAWNNDILEDIVAFVKVKPTTDNCLELVAENVTRAITSEEADSSFVGNSQPVEETREACKATDIKVPSGNMENDGPEEKHMEIGPTEELREKRESSYIKSIRIKESLGPNNYKGPKRSGGCNGIIRCCRGNAGTLGTTG